MTPLDKGLVWHISLGIPRRIDVQMDLSTFLCPLVFSSVFWFGFKSLRNICLRFTIVVLVAFSTISCISKVPVKPGEKSQQ